MGTSSRVSPSRTSGHGPAAPTQRTPEAELLELHSALAVLANAKELGLLAPYLRTCELHSRSTSDPPISGLRGGGTRYVRKRAAPPLDASSQIASDWLTHECDPILLFPVLRQCDPTFLSWVEAPGGDPWRGPLVGAPVDVLRRATSRASSYEARCRPAAVVCVWMELDRTDWCNLVPSCSTDPPVAHGLAILWFSEDLLIAPTFFGCRGDDPTHRHRDEGETTPTTFYSHAESQPEVPEISRFISHQFPSSLLSSALFPELICGSLEALCSASAQRAALILPSARGLLALARPPLQNSDLEPGHTGPGSRQYQCNQTKH
ncbi:unnamed protein product [Gadus morhua 'NCC']